MTHGGPARASLFGLRFDLLTAEELRAWVRAVLAGPAETRRIAFSNPEFVLEARRSQQLRRYLNGCSLNLIDGIGLVQAFRLVRGIRPPERLTGTDFVPMLCDEAAATGARLFLFGGRPGVAARAAAALERRTPGLQVCGAVDGFAGAAGVLEQIRAAAPDVLMVCLGNPRQERWIDEHIGELDLKLVFGNGGALDFWSGDVPQAPGWVRRAGLEWLYRLITNFSVARLKRQLRLAEFVGLVARARVRRGDRRRRTDADGLVDPATLRRVQLIELDVLRELGRRCEEASLRWFVIGGTLLGAARHRGFIPWDDDIDVGMPRADYERFEALCRRSSDARFAWQSATTDPAYPFMYGKLLRAGTHVVEPALAHLPIRHAISIDVFPLDGTPGSELGRRVHGLAFKVAATTLGARIRRSGPRRYAAYLFRAIPRSWATGLIDRLVAQFPYDASPYVVNASGAWGYRRECQPRGRLEPSATLPFEGMTVPVPGRWHEYLTQVYGDYLQLPPPDKRRARHRFTIRSLGDAVDAADPAPRWPEP